MTQCRVMTKLIPLLFSSRARLSSLPTNHHLPLQLEDSLLKLADSERNPKQKRPAAAYGEVRVISPSHPVSESSCVRVILCPSHPVSESPSESSRVRVFLCPSHPVSESPFSICPRWLSLLPQMHARPALRLPYPVLPNTSSECGPVGCLTPCVSSQSPRQHPMLILTDTPSFIPHGITPLY